MLLSRTLLIQRKFYVDNWRTFTTFVSVEHGKTGTKFYAKQQLIAMICYPHWPPTRSYGFPCLRCNHENEKKKINIRFVVPERVDLPISKRTTTSKRWKFFSRATAIGEIVLEFSHHRQSAGPKLNLPIWTLDLY